MTRIERKPLLLLSAALAGAGGLAGEGLLITSLGLLVGQGRAGALGLCLWIAGWALGAWIAGRSPASRARHWLVGAGVLAGAGIPLAFTGLHLCAGGALPPATWGAAGALLVLMAALPQGAFLPLLARSWSAERGGARDVSWLFAANLAAAVAAARYVSFDLAASHSRTIAALCAGALSLLAGGLGYLGAGARASSKTSAAGGSAVPLRIGCVAALVTAWLVGIEWAGLRLGAVWLGGGQPAVTAVLCGSLAALALGAALLPRCLPADARAPLALLPLAALGSAWILSPWSSAAFSAGWPDSLAALVLLGPALLPLGAVIPTLHRSLSKGESGRRLGDLLLYEVWGVALGVPLLHWVLLPALGTAACLGILGALALPSAWLLTSSHLKSKTLASVSALGVLVWGFLAPEPVLASKALSNPAFTVLSFDEDEHFAVTVVDDGVRAERTLLTDDFRATAVGDDYLYMRVLGHLPLLLHPRPERVAVLAFGTGTTAGAVSVHPGVRRIDLLEISPAVIAAAPFFEDVNRGVAAEGLPGLLDPDDGQGRVVLHLDDGRRSLLLAERTWDVITMEPLLPDSPFAVHLYTHEFYAIARNALAPGGLLCQWVPPHALAPEPFDAVLAAFCQSFPWSGVFLFGTQVVLLGADAEPALDPGRFPAPGTDLYAALAPLGLEDAAGVLARYVTGGSSWPLVPRPLTDRDPWIVYRRTRTGAQHLADLPRNLARLRTLEEFPPSAWTVTAGVAGLERLEQVRTLHHAREAWRRWDMERRGLRAPGEGPGATLDVWLARLRDADDPEVQQFRRQVEFDAMRTGGVLDLAAKRHPEALAKLTTAIELRPGRADLHLFMALVAQRLGHAERALRAWEKALGLCPRILETPQGQRALQLGLRFPGLAPPTAE
jgi:spermidine synthase